MTGRSRNTAGTITCVGRTVDDRLQPVGDECGALFIANAGDLVGRARFAGWAVTGSPDSVGVYTGMCPRCRRPPDAAVALARAQDRTRR